MTQTWPMRIGMAVVLLLAAAIAIFLLVFDWNWLKSPIEKGVFAATGRTLEIKGWTQATRTLELWEPARLALQSGDQFRVYAGCHKRIKEDCRDKFQIPGSLLFANGNARNFRGEPYVPGAPLVAVAT